MWDSNGDIDNGSSVQVVDPGNMHVSGKIDGNSFVFLVSTGGSIHVDGKIDGTSRVDLVSNRGSINIDGKIDGGSKVLLTAAINVSIGLGPKGGDGDRKIDGNSTVTATAGGNISLGGGISKDHTSVDFAA